MLVEVCSSIGGVSSSSSSVSEGGSDNGSGNGSGSVVVV